jgi:hypothetical protein
MKPYDHETDDLQPEPEPAWMIYGQWIAAAVAGTCAGILIFLEVFIR